MHEQPARLTTPIEDVRHPAVIAWERLQGRTVSSLDVEILKQTPRSGVYRINGAVEQRTSVVAKRRTHVGMEYERIIYEEVLPMLDIPKLTFYGCLQEEDCCWLFVEDAGGDPYQSQLTEHRLLSAEWLAALHMATLSSSLQDRLPDRGPAYFLGHLRNARTMIQDNLTNPVLRQEHLLILHTLLNMLGGLEDNWRNVEGLYNASPHSLIHGDFVRKNLRVRTSANSLSLGVFDWEIAGRGLSTIDLVQQLGKSADPELDLYYSTIGAIAGSSGAPTKESLELGFIFRLLAAISWTSDSLPYEWIESAVENLQLFKARLDVALGATGLAKSREDG